jgi:hypothetical protein
MSEPATAERSPVEMSEAATMECSSAMEMSEAAAMEMSEPAAESAMEAPEVMEAMEPPKAVEAAKTTKPVESAEAAEPAEAVESPKTPVESAEAPMEATKAPMEATKASMKAAAAPAESERRFWRAQTNAKAKRQRANEGDTALPQCVRVLPSNKVFAAGWHFGPGLHSGALPRFRLSPSLLGWGTIYLGYGNRHSSPGRTKNTHSGSKVLDFQVGGELCFASARL